MTGAVVAAEEFRFQFRLRAFVAPYGDQRSCRPGTGLVDAMGQPLFAGTRFALEQQIVVAPGNPGCLMLQGQELAGVPHHAVQAVPGTVPGGMGDGGLQVLDGHGDDHHAVHLASGLHRQYAGHIFIGTVLGDPGDFLAQGALAGQAFLDRDVLIVQEHLIQPLAAFQPFPAVGVGIAQAAVLVHPVHGSRDFLGNQATHLPVRQHGQEVLHRILHGHEQAQQDVIGQILLVQGKQGQDVPALACHVDGGRAGIPGMAVPDPHFRPEHQERHIVGPCHTNAGGTHVLLQDPHALDILDAPLEEGQGVVLQHIAFLIHQQHAQVVGVEVLFVLFEQTVHILHHILVPFQGLLQVLEAQTHPMGRHGLVVQFSRFTPVPGLSHPRMDIGIDDSLIDEFIVIAGQLFLIASFPNHWFPPCLFIPFVRRD